LSPDELDPGDSAGPPPPARGPPLREREGAPRGAGPAARAGGLRARKGPSGASLLAGSRPCPDLFGPRPAPASAPDTAARRRARRGRPGRSRVLFEAGDRPGGPVRPVGADPPPGDPGAAVADGRAHRLSVRGRRRAPAGPRERALYVPALRQPLLADRHDSRCVEASRGD